MTTLWSTFTLKILLSSSALVARTLAFIVLFCGVVSAEEGFSWRDPAEYLQKAYPHLEIHYVDVVGKAPEEVREQIDGGPVKDHLGKPRDAYLSWKISWRWPFKNSAPDFARSEVRLEPTLTLPRWLDYPEATSVAKKKWRAYIKALLKHEEQHIRHGEQAAEGIQAALQKGEFHSEREANDAARALVRNARIADSEYDKRTEFGKLEGVVFP